MWRCQHPAYTRVGLEPPERGLRVQNSARLMAVVALVAPKGPGHLGYGRIYAYWDEVSPTRCSRGAGRVLSLGVRVVVATRRLGAAPIRVQRAQDAHLFQAGIQP